jgi:hypothetical protein
MAQPLRHNLNGLPLFQQEGGVGVAQIVKTDDGDPRPTDGRLKHARDMISMQAST